MSLSDTAQNLNYMSVRTGMDGNEIASATWRVCVELDRLVVEMQRLNTMVERIAFPIARMDAPDGEAS